MDQTDAALFGAMAAGIAWVLVLAFLVGCDEPLAVG
jgi:hypothetical protein